MESWQTIILIGGIVVVCAAVLPRRMPSGKQEQSTQTVRNMETALEQFMENMEADNRELVELVSKSTQDTQLQSKKRDERTELLEKRCAELELLLVEQTKLHASALEQQSAQISNFTIPVTDTHAAHSRPQHLIPAVTSDVEAEEMVEDEEPILTIRDRYTDLFDMYQSGKSIDAIAKKLGKNKGEVQLILQLSKQEEAARHE
ncbi:DUF6115 domain-containing protein [Paenibacillus sp. CF384]|uniref:DUF6115 domain-containing protein n=1 Tax=Paenibacillus sp. CF384 TaxID=1884382 RepID=UPI000896C556|nr:hypothetical protein [Paenibacillus sp. CF384]SDW26972.1 hypothetical protein SAMN05518855_1001873 [Paenibacillus sp. CF384]